MADEGFSWDEVEVIDEPTPTAAVVTAAGEEGAPAAGAEKDPEEPRVRYVPQKDSDIQASHFPRYIKRDIKKTRAFEHWVRPTYLQYRYNYDYAHNYYDDVIKYMNSKRKGEPVKELPRPQTWAERALRTYTKDYSDTATYEKNLSDDILLKKVKYSAKFYAQHSKEFYNRKYRDVLYSYIIHW